MIGAVTRQSSVRDRGAIYWGDPHIESLVVMFVPERSLAFATQPDRFLSHNLPIF